MALVAPTYLVDTGGQQWQLDADNSALIRTSPTSGHAAFASILINDLVGSQTWRMTILPASSGPDWGKIQIDPIAFQSVSNQILVNSPNGTLYAIQVSGGLLQISLGSLCITTFLNLKDALSRRLNDPGKVFWVDAELKLYIAEALRTWNALTATWNADFTFTITGPASQVWYDLRTLVGYPRKPTLTDNDIYTIMQYHLLEPATGGGTWTGSSQFALTDLQQALSRRRDEIIQLAGTNLAQFNITAAVGQRRATFADNVLEIRRTRYVPGDLTNASIATLWRDDGLGFQDFAPNYLQGDPSPGQQPASPQQYNLTSNPPLSLDVDYPPPVGGVYDTIALVSGACFSPPTPSLLSIPDDLSWVAKWGAMSDLLGSEDERQDAARADYCLQRYKDGVTLATQAPWLLLGQLNGIPYDTVSFTEMDQYAPEWDSDPNAPAMLVMAGLDFLAVSPIPTANTDVTLTVVQNAPIPIADNDTVQASRDVLDAILDYAQSLSSFKQGGAEFSATKELVKNFALAATATNSRLEAIGIFRDVLEETGRLEEETQERFAEQS